MSSVGTLKYPSNANSLPGLFDEPPGPCVSGDGRPERGNDSAAPHSATGCRRTFPSTCSATCWAEFDVVGPEGPFERELHTAGGQSTMLGGRWQRWAPQFPRTKQSR